ncbi:hypothetical protein ACM66B_001558 [Microbotryomycetes sp. NB124-2]
MLSQQIAQGVPELSEQELETIYRGLMDSSPYELRQIDGLLSSPEQTGLLISDGSWSERASTVRKERLMVLDERVRALQAGTGLDTTHEDGAISKSKTRDVQAHTARDVLDRVVQLHATDGTEPRTASIQVEEEQDLPRGLLTRSEWQDLVLACAEDGSVEDVMRALEAMQRYVPLKNGDIMSRLLARCADEGRPRDAMALAQFAKQNALPLSTFGHHHVLRSLVPDHPEMAVQHLHALEAAGYTPLIESYTVVIDRLLSPESPSHLVSRGWDLYAHTRLVSHPTPSADLFTTMIQACSRSAVPSPERALDLFTEMTADNNLVPSEKTYNAVIRTCTREGSIENYFEGLRLMKRMLDDNIMPTRHTFHALLEGARRHGDLARARWMLVKMVGIGGESVPDANTFGLVFQTYAAYKLPVRGNVPATRKEGDELVASRTMSSKEDGGTASKADTVARDGGFDGDSAGQEAHETESTASKEVIELLGQDSLFYPGPLPQTTADLLREARTLFYQCVNDRQASARDFATNQDGRRSKAFSKVRATPFLLNSFQTVLARQAPFNDFVEFFDRTWADLDVRKNRFTFEEAMVRSETAKNRDAGLKFARRVFEEWQKQVELAGAIDSTVHEAEGRQTVEGQSDGVGQGANVSRMWASMIRNLARCFKLEEAKALLQRFYEAHSPAKIVQHAHDEIVQARTALPRQPSLVRLSSPLYPETTMGSKSRLVRDQVHVPFILFEHVKVLHLRLANIEDEEGVKLVAKVCGDYAKAVKMAKSIREHGAPLVDEDRRGEKQQQQKVAAEETF